MAKGSFSSSVYTGAGTGFSRYIEVEWSSTNDVENNQSTITWTAYCRSEDSSTVHYVGAKNIVITFGDQETVIVDANTVVHTYKDDVLGSGSLVVDHTNTGQKTLSVKIAAQFYVYGTDNSTYSGSISLTTNPVYTLHISQGTGCNVTVVRTSCRGVGSTGLLTAGEKTLNYGDNLKIIFNTFTNYTITKHLVNGSTFTSGNTKVVTSGIYVVAEAALKSSSISATNSSIGSDTIIAINTSSDNYTHTLRYKFGDLEGTIATKTSETEVAWTLPSSFYEQMGTSQAETCTLYCDTYSSSTLLGTTSCTFQVYADESTCSPEIVATVKDINETTIALTGDSNVIVRYKSTALCELIATAKESATILSLDINGNDVVVDTPDTSVTVTAEYPDTEATSFKFTATDSRSFTASTTVTPTVIPYVKLTCNPVIKRPTGSSNSFVMTVTGNVYRGSFGNAENTFLLEYRYCDETGTYSDWQTIDNGQLTFSSSSYRSSDEISLGEGFDYRKVYSFQVRATDGTATVPLTVITKTISVKKGIPVFDWGANDFNFNVMVTINNQNILDIMRPIGTVYMCSSDTLPTEISSHGEWASITSEIDGVYMWERTG